MGYEQTTQRKSTQHVSPCPPIDPDDVGRYLAWQRAWYIAIGEHGYSPSAASRWATSQIQTNLPIPEWARGASR